MPTADFVTMDQGQLIVATDFWPLLQAEHLTSFATVMSRHSQDIVRAVPGRATVRLELPGHVGYLKHYEPRWLRWPGATDEAAREWNNLQLLRQHGFLTALPVALGQRRRGGTVIESFLWQQEIPAGIPAETYFLERCPDPTRRRQLLAQIGAWAGQFQRAGFIHKDFNLRHIFIVERGPGWDLFLIDLQRLRGPGWHRRRWYIKDLGSLAYSAHVRARLSRSDLLRLYYAFAGVQHLNAPDKRLIRQIWQRVQRLRRRPPKYQRVWNAPVTSTPTNRD